MMHSSAELHELAAALTSAQAVMGGALKDSSNPFFKSRYADLESVWTAIRAPLTAHGLSVIQGTDQNEAGALGITTRLLHRSGQWIESDLWLTPKDLSPQSIGSAISYGRRYALAAICGIYQTDDDAEAAQGRPMAPQPFKAFGTPPQAPDEYAVDPEVVTEFADSLRRALTLNRPSAVAEIHAELNQDRTMYQAVWKALNTKEKAAVRECIPGTKKDGANGN